VIVGRFALEMSRTDGGTPWDRRLAERWARPAREVANEPPRHGRTPHRERFRSPFYLIALAASVSLLHVGLAKVGGWPGDAIVGSALGVSFAVNALDHRSSSRRSP
jgi:hypothetical protein